MSQAQESQRGSQSDIDQISLQVNFLNLAHLGITEACGPLLRSWLSYLFNDEKRNTKTSYR